MARELADPESENNHTPLTDDETAGLRLPLFFKNQLNEAEATNITAARSWVLLRRRPIPARQILTEKWLKTLHKKMFGDVWKWAGEYRTSEKNLGDNSWEIPMNVRNLLDDAHFWMDDSTPSALSADEIAVQFSHRSVLIHPFANGNGRWSRLLADALAVSLGNPPFSWGSGSATNEILMRKQYIDALREADHNHDYEEILRFARS